MTTKMVRYRSAKTGRFVQQWVNQKYPDTTIRDVIKVKPTTPTNTKKK